MEHSHDIKASVQSNKICQSQRTHGNISAQFHCFVNVFLCANTFVQGINSLVDVGHQQTVSNESRNISGCWSLLSHQSCQSELHHMYFWVVSNVWSEVWSPRITSTSFITGTGFIKCIPITCPGLSVALAKSVIEIDEVLLAKMADFFTTLSTDAKTDFFTLEFSTIASTTKSTSLSWSVWISLEKTKFFLKF